MPKQKRKWLRNAVKNEYHLSKTKTPTLYFKKGQERQKCHASGMNLLKLEFDCVITLQKKLFANQLKKPKKTGKCGNLKPQNPIVGKPKRNYKARNIFYSKIFLSVRQVLRMIIWNCEISLACVLRGHCRQLGELVFLPPVAAVN